MTLHPRSLTALVLSLNLLAFSSAHAALTVSEGQAGSAQLTWGSRVDNGTAQSTYSNSYVRPNDSQAREMMEDDPDSVEPVTIQVRRSGIGGVVDRLTDTGREIAHQTLNRFEDALDLTARAALVMDPRDGKVLFDKHGDTAVPIASITKLMTAMVTADARLDMAEKITFEPEDFVGPKRASSHLKVGDTLNRAEVMLIALMKSENPAAKALARTYPGGISAFMRAMNAKARSLGMTSAFFGDPTGLDSRNVASPRDLAKMVNAAYGYGVIRQFTTQQSYDFDLGNRILSVANTNALVRDGYWNIGLSKTGFISEAGRCLVMQAQVNQRPAVIVLMGADTSQGRSGDANRILSWLQSKF